MQLDSRLLCRAFTQDPGSVSQVRLISASILIQGSAIDPSILLYVDNASDLHTINDGNEICKYADNTYLIVRVRIVFCGHPLEQ